MVVVRSKNILGPYVDKKGRSILKGTNYEIINQGNSRFSGPGHNSEIITDDDGNDWVLYHAYDLNRSSPVRSLILSQVKWVGGWPVIHNGTPPAITETPYFKSAYRAPMTK
jgi:arabinan endo-1,5-alpha-L-arabinosidase